jgi:hypothetical protein
MTTTEIIKSEYFKHTRNLLHDLPETLHKFEELWEAGKLREAYLCVDEIVRNQGIIRSPEQQKADEDFYWEVVN